MWFAPEQAPVCRAASKIFIHRPVVSASAETARLSFRACQPRSCAASTAQKGWPARRFGAEADPPKPGTKPPSHSIVAWMLAFVVSLAVARLTVSA
jgi:hypothetical protein